MKISLITLLILFCFFPLLAQDKVNSKKKVYEAWVKPDNSSDVIKGVLYETGDSSIFLVPYLQSGLITEFPADSIYLLKVRREKSVRRGLITGSILGFGTGVIIGIPITDFIFFKGFIATYMGIAGGIVGLGAGALAGSVKDRFPVKKSYENFDKYTGSLQHYSYLDEEPARPKFVHRGYIASSMGISHASGEFAHNVPVSSYPGMNMTGIIFKGELGYFFTNNMGINWTSRHNQYSAGEFDQFMVWSFSSDLIGPVISLPASERIRFDFIPAIGYSSACLWKDDEEIYTGGGFGLGFTGKMAYIMSKRWNFSVSSGYVSSKQKYEQGGDGEARTLDISLGLDYKFGKKSL